MDIRELPKILLKEFCSGVRQISVRDIQQNVGEVWEGQLIEGVGVFIYEDPLTKAKYLKVYRQKDCGMQNGKMCRPAFFEIRTLPKYVGHDALKGNIYQDTITIGWPIHATNLREEPYISIICKIIVRAQDLIHADAFEFPTYYISSQTPDGVRNPI